MDNYYNTSDDSSPGLGYAALALGICSVALFLTGISFITGALGILLALLSRGTLPMKSAPKAGLILSAAGLAIELAIFSFGIYLFQSGALEPYVDQLEEIYEELYEDSAAAPADLPEPGTVVTSDLPGTWR